MESLAHAKRRPVRGTHALADTPLVCGVLGVWGKRRYVQRNDRPSSRFEVVEDSLEGALGVPGIRQEHERGACEKDRAIPGRKGEGLHLPLVQTDTQSAGLSPSLALDEHVPRRIEPVDSQPCFDQIEERVPGSASC